MVKPDVTVDHEVAIVGYGPVGQTLAALLGRAGHRVVVYDRHPEAFPLPRAVRFDHEAMRIFQGLKAIPLLEHEIATTRHYLWYGAQGQLILDLDAGETSPSGWRPSYSFHQPALEAALDRTARAQPSVTVQRGWEVIDLGQTDEYAQLTLREHRASGPVIGGAIRTVRARYVVGADGANSFVRRSLAIGQDDFGFRESWLVIDVHPHDIAQFAHLPGAAQYCNPRRPHVAVLGGPRHRRWEFMVLPGDDVEALRCDPARAWELLRPYMTPEHGTIIRQTIYEFRSLLSHTLRSGRFFLAGDAAKQMPPFMAEGMCSGLRDAANLAWRLDLALRGMIADAALDSYSSERQGQNRISVLVSLEMGKVSCTTDPRTAAERDARLLSGQVPPPAPVPPLGTGILHRPERDPIAGRVSVQGRIETRWGSGRTDDVVPPGFRIVCAQGDPVPILGPDRMAYLARLGASVLTLDPAVPGSARDLDGELTCWLRDRGIVAALCRPDFYAFGAATSLQDLPGLVDDLRAQLG